MANKKKSSISRSASLVMLLTGVSRVLGFVRTAVFSSYFGGGGTADVLNLVFSIPNNLRKLMAEGALSSAFIPVLSTTVTEDDSNAESQKLFALLFTLQCIILIPLSVLAVVFAPQIIGFFFDFPIPEQQVLGVELFRYLIHYSLLISLSALFMGTLHAHGIFSVPAVTPLLFSISVIASIVFLEPKIGIYSMVFGVLFGGVVQLFFQLPLLLKIGYRRFISIDFDNANFRLIIKRWIPVVLTSSIYTVNQQISMFLASGLEVGSSTALLNALIFWQLPFGIFSASIATVFFPSMSLFAAKNERDKLNNVVNLGLGSLFALLIPSAVLLITMGYPAISVALQRGAYSADHSLLAAKVLVGYSFGLFSVAAFNFLQRLFYALGQYRAPLFIAIVTMTIDVLLCICLRITYLRVVGLAVANSVAFSIGLVIMIIVVTKKYRISIYKSVFIEAIKVLLASAFIAFLSGFLVKMFLWDTLSNGSTLYNWLATVIIGLLCILVLLLLYFLLDIYVVKKMFPGLMLRRKKGRELNDDK